MKFLNLQLPEIDERQAEEHLASAYGLSGRLRRLSSERDVNFHVAGAEGGDVVLKFTNHEEPVEILEAQIAALDHIEDADPGLPVPRVRRTKDGKALSLWRGKDGREHHVLVLSYLAGEVPGKGALSAKELERVARATARLGRALSGFSHPALIGRQLLWDNAEAAHLLPQVDLLGAEWRDLVRDILTRFVRDDLPRLKRLAHQPIHGDVHPYNVLLDAAGEVSGLIDFGDLIVGAPVQDLANLFADFLHDERGTAETLTALMKGFQRERFLEEAEVDLLLPLTLVRLVQGPLIIAQRAADGVMSADYLEKQLSDRFLEKAKRLVGAEGKALALLARRLAGAPAREKQPLDKMLARRNQVMGDKFYLFYSPPLHVVKGEGVWLWDADGRLYLDCYNNVPHVGHCHPTVAAAIARQARQLNTNTRYVTDQAIEYAERLSALAGEGLTAVVYVNSGSEANDVAWRMAKTWTGARGGLAMEFAYHGITEASDAFSPANDAKGRVAEHLALLVPPDDYRGPFKRGEKDLGARYAALADGKIADLQKKGLGLAAAMIDSAFMTNGMLEAPQGYLSGVVERVRKAGGLFIADEVQSGFGRLGTAFWGHRHHGVTPDFITIGKPAGNGHPIGAVITRPEILDRFMAEGAFFSTFGGNNVSAAAGIAVLDVIESEGLVENARLAGAALKAGLKSLMAKHAAIGDVRGTGLALGVELVRDRKTLQPAAEECKRLQSLIRDQGVLVGGEGFHGNILKVRPPIAFTSNEVPLVIEAFDQALQKL